MNKIQKLRKAREEKAAQIKAIQAIEDATEEQLDQALTLADEIKALDAQLEKLTKIAAIDVGDLAPQQSTEPAERITQTSAIQTRENVMRDPMKGFQTPREFFNTVMRFERGQIREEQLPVGARLLMTNEQGVPIRAAAGGDEQSTFSDPYGGFLVPEGMSPDLLQVTAEADPTMGRTTVIPMDTPIIRIPARVDKDHSNSVTGGLRWYRRAEADTVAASRMELERIELRADNLMGLAYVTEELLRDSPRSVAAMLADGFSVELRSFLLNERLNGNGAGEMQGTLNSGNGALVSIAKEGGQSADTINFQNILKVRSRVWGYQNAVWIANHDTLPQLGQLSLAVGTGGSAVFVPSVVPDLPDMLLGRPLFFSEYVPTVGDAGDISCQNFSQYLEGIYQPLESAESIHVRFVNHERAFKFSARIGGAPWWRSALTPKNGANTLSPFVQIAARA